MTEKEIVLETIRALPDDCSLEEIAERIDFIRQYRKVSTNDRRCELGWASHDRSCYAAISETANVVKARAPWFQPRTEK